MSKTNNNTQTVSIQPNKLSEKERQKMVTATMAMATAFWGKLQSAIIDIQLLEVDMTYQRITHGKLSHLINNFNYLYMSPLTISYRNGHFYIVDGQHRAIAACRNGITQIPCIIHTGLTQADEAKIFSLQKNCSSNLKPFDTFKANLVWGEPTDCAIKALCDKYALVIRERQTKPFTMSSVTAARAIATDPRSGLECLDWIFDTFDAAKWLSEQNACAYTAMLAMEATYIEAVKDNALYARTQRLIETFLHFRPGRIQDFAGVKYGKDKRKACAELYKDIAKGVYTASDIEQIHIANE